MGAGITLNVETKSLQSGFKKVLDKGKNLQPLMFNIGEYLVAETDDRFDEERDPDGFHKQNRNDVLNWLEALPKDQRDDMKRRLNTIQANARKARFAA